MDNCQAIKYSQFDSDIFGIDYFRVVLLDKQAIQNDIQTLKPQSIVDVKIDSDNVEFNTFLQEQGFEKICEQTTLHIRRIRNVKKPKDVCIDEYLDMSDSKIKQHSQNFVCNRFALNKHLDKDKSFYVYEKWIKNSLQNKAIKIAHINNDFCTFKIDGDTISLDLLSVLNKQQGIGKILLQAIENWSLKNNMKKIIATTESNNKIALGLYKRYGFSIDSFTNCLTLIN